MEVLWNILTGIEGAVGLGIFAVIAIGYLFISRKDIREINKIKAQIKNKVGPKNKVKA